MRRVFVDSGGFFAALSPDDPQHGRAMQLFQQAEAENWQLVTTNAVVIECYALFLIRSRRGRAAAVTCLDLVLGDEYAVERFLPEDEARAVAIVRAHEDKTYSLCDALSFAVMERLGIPEVIAFDKHFREFGRFTVL